VDSTNERGLAGIAFDAAFASNGHIYCHHSVPATLSSAVHNRVARIHVNAAAPGTSDGTETDLPDLNDLSADYHNGDGLHPGQKKSL
jgi:hypothetical protein